MASSRDNEDERQRGAASRYAEQPAEDPSATEGTGTPAASAETLVSADLQDTYVLLLDARDSRGMSWGRNVPPSCYLETNVTVVAQLRTGELPPVSLSEPMTIPEGSTLRWEAMGEGHQSQARLQEATRLDAQLIRVTTTSMRGQVEDPFAGLQPLGVAVTENTLPVLERSLGRTADLDLSREGTLGAYQHFVSTGAVPLADPDGGVLRSGRVAVFTQQRVPGRELAFLRQFHQMDAASALNVQWSAEYDDGSVEVRASARFTGRMVLWHVLIDPFGQQTRGDVSVVFSQLTPRTVAALARGLRGAAEGLEGQWHVELLLADQEVILWRHLARLRICERNGMEVARFEREARTRAMAHWEGEVGLQALALARTPDEVGDTLVRLGDSAEGAAQALAQLMSELGAPLEGTLRIAPAQST